MALSIIPKSQAMEEKCLFNTLLDKNIKIMILADAAIIYYYKYNHPGELASTCKNWRDLIKNSTNHSTLEYPFFKTLTTIQEYCYYNIYKNGKLIYTRNPGKDFEVIDIPEDFEPFDINECGKTSKHLKITAGYKKVVPVNEEEKLQIWIVLRSMIKKELEIGKAEHIRDIFPNWSENKPIGIFWTLVRNYQIYNNDGIKDLINCYNYSTEDFKSISDSNLFAKWRQASNHGDNGSPANLYYYGHNINLAPGSIQKFSFCFNPWCEFSKAKSIEAVIPEYYCKHTKS